MLEGERIALVLASGECGLKPVFLGANVADPNLSRCEEHLAEFDEGRHRLWDAAKGEGEASVVVFGGWNHVGVFRGGSQAHECVRVPNDDGFAFPLVEALFDLNVGQSTEVVNGFPLFVDGDDDLPHTLRRDEQVGHKRQSLQNRIEH